MVATRRGRRARGVLCSVVLVGMGTASACTDMTGSNTKAGGDPAPISLTMGTNEIDGSPSARQIQEFARQVEEHSGGSLVIEPRLDALGTADVTEWDQKVARLVMDGELDLGLIPTRAWDTEGVDTFRALSTPFLLTTDTATNRVVSDDELAADLMSGLEPVGATGLALVPEGLRHLFLYGERALTADTLDGAVVRAPRSATTWAFLEALGARPTDRTDAGSFDAAESAFAIAPSGVARVAVGNLTLFPKVNVVAANSDTYAELSGEHQQVLADAALATRDWAVEENEADAALAAAWCDGGSGEVTHARDEVVADIHDAARSVVEELRADPQTAGMIARIADHSERGNPGVVPECRGSDPGPADAYADLTPTGGRLPDGTYRTEYTEAFLRPRVISEEHVANNAGVWTFKLRDGHWSFVQHAPGFTDSSAGLYEVHGDDLYWKLEEGQVLHFRWSTDDEGDLHFDQYRDLGWEADPTYPFPDFQFAREWVRVE